MIASLGVIHSLYALLLQLSILTCHHTADGQEIGDLIFFYVLLAGVMW